ncbi:hypothetical protein [Treponema bryantii]|uniref:hypothetical protein n=1 Tax=Treponema bryantii TaxID=163 RepID=UPI0030C8CA14
MHFYRIKTKDRGIIENGDTMLKDYEIDKPILETDRLIIRVLNEADLPDLKE